MNSSFNEVGVQVAWDATSIKRALKCLRYYYLKNIEGWERRGLSVHLRFGQHYATALEHFYKHRALGLSSEEALVEVVWEALKDTWDREWEETTDEALLNDYLVEASALYRVDPDGKKYRQTGPGKPWQSDHPAKTRENLIRTICWYVAEFENESIEVIRLSDGKPAVEYSFSLPVDNGITFCGHIDRLVDYGGNPYVMDQKTTGSVLTPYYFDQYSPDDQMSMYTFAGRQIYALPVKGVIIDAAQIAVGFTRFARGFTARTDTQLSEWYDDTLSTIEGAQRATREQHFPMNSTSCGDFGGCEFRHVCSRSPEVRPQFLAADFEKKETWDPLKRR